ncbi:adenylyltransferase/sulfurtransferase [Flavobacteriaceae bacterium MAR_2010_72]|nr:adenylyltransferase/sulfurtransferase [Flavobacteriaceae bacterium MAR_2010_72]TVZ59510.1 adenylyltransferase/sulfurtransferase [Flavobacteriaceae bacterium MAR_2010_105]
MNRYSRHIQLSEVGSKGQDQISNAKVLVVGAGGLGCPVLQYLVAAGVGTLGIIDFDVVEESNLQRQVLFGTSSLGANKAIAAKKRLEDLNPTITIIAYQARLTSTNALELFKDYDLIVDGTDNFATRYLINDASILCDKPFVYGAIYKFEGQVSVFNYNNGPSYRCLFPTLPNVTSAINCSEIGVLGVLPGIIGTMMANEVLKMILGFEQVLSGKLLCYSSRTAETTILKINKVQSNFDTTLIQKELALDQYEDDFCGDPNMEISSEDLVQLGDVQFIDVREHHELPKFELENCVQIPLATLNKNIDKLDLTKPLVVFCQTGIRSLKAVEQLRQRNTNTSFSLKGGVQTLIEELNIKT